MFRRPDRGPRAGLIRMHVGALEDLTELTEGATGDDISAAMGDLGSLANDARKEHRGDKASASASKKSYQTKTVFLDLGTGSTAPVGGGPGGDDVDGSGDEVEYLTEKAVSKNARTQIKAMAKQNVDELGGLGSGHVEADDDDRE
eukprot:768730-Pyramimonas_sp.AAC.1